MFRIPRRPFANVAPMVTHRSWSHSWSIDELYPIASGVLLALSLPPFKLSFLALFALVPLFLYFDKEPSVSRVVRGGIIASLLYFGINLGWLNTLGAFSWLIFPGYAAILVIYTCNFFLFVLITVLAKSYLAIDYVFTAPFAWIVAERLRCFGDLAFPWSTLGYALTSAPFFLQFADVAGVYGVSFVLVLVNALLFRVVRPPAARAGAGRYAMACAVVVATIVSYDAYRWLSGAGAASSYLEVAVLQPNVPQRLKWEPAYSREIVKRLFSMHGKALGANPRLVVWPETAIPFYIDERRPLRLTEMGDLSRNSAYILTGLLNVGYTADRLPHFYNSAALFAPAGDMLGHYKKIYLVPGFELYPFRHVIGFTRSFFASQRLAYAAAMEPGDDETLFSIPGAKFSALICYESAFPQLARHFRLRGAEFLVNVTNDAWFGRSFGPYQHASFLVMRAIENRTAIVRSANSGFSGLIDPMGRWAQKSDLFSGTILSARIPLTTEMTFYTRHGDLIVYAAYAALLFLLVMALAKKYREA
jgi:apolipoprotein N-acyltransferase